MFHGRKWRQMFGPIKNLVVSCISENYGFFPEVVDDVIAISSPCKSQIFNLLKISAVVPPTTSKSLLTPFLALFSYFCIATISGMKKIQDIWKIHAKFFINHVTDHFRKKMKIFRVTRDNKEHDAKTVCQ